MEGEAGVLQDRVEAAAVERRRIEPQERVRGEQHEGEEADPISACTPSTRARKEGGRLRPSSATAAPNRDRIQTQRTSEPSWLPQVPLIL